MNTMIKPSSSFDSMDGCLNYDDDDCFSLMSMSSADFVLNMINETSTQIEDGHVIDVDITQDETKCDELDESIEPMGDLDQENIVSDDDECQRNFSLEQEQASLDGITDSVSHEEWDDDLSSLLTGEIIELPMLVSEPAIHRMKQETQSCQEEQHQVAPFAGSMATGAQQQRPLLQQVPDPILRIMACIHYTEKDSQVVLQAEGIVRDCQIQFQKRNREYKQEDLSGTIIERLVKVFGGPRLAEIYRNSQTFDATYYVAQRTAAYQALLKPDTLQLAIAYGLLLARNQIGPVSCMEMVHSGVASLNSMSENEQMGLWDYVTTLQG